MNHTPVADVDFCHWYIDEHQLHLTLPDNTGEYISDYVCPECTTSAVSLLTQDVDFDLL